MSAINVLNITVLDNPATFTDNLKFEITFECISILTEGVCCWLIPTQECCAVLVGHDRSPLAGRQCVTAGRGLDWIGW